MKNMPEKYKINQKALVKDIIIKGIKAADRQKIRKCVKNVVLTYQIYDEDIPSVKNEIYFVRNIQTVDIELDDIKNATYAANIFQEKISKNLCILRLFDEVRMVYSFALKRLNQNDREEIVITDKVMTEIFDKRITSERRKEVEDTLDFNNILNRTNKVNFYLEIFIKNYILKNQKNYIDSKKFLKTPIWYDENRMNNFFETFKKVILAKEKIKKTISNSEKIAINKEIREKISILDKMIKKI